MSGETTLTVIGNLTAAPELRFTQSGKPVANFTVASTPRRFDRERQEWVDQPTLFTRCAVWGDAAEQVAESLDKGTRVVVVGQLQPTEWTDRESGAKRTGTQLLVDEVGPSLRYASAKVTRTQRAGRAAPGQGGWGDQQAPAADPWATPAGGPSYGDEPPF